MKHSSIAGQESDEDIVSDYSMSASSYLHCDDAAALKQTMFLKGIIKAKEDELTRLRKEKEAAMETKFRVLAEMGGLKKDVEDLVQALKEKELVIEQVNTSKEQMVQKLSHERKEKEVAMEAARKIKEEMAKMTGLQKELAEQSQMHLHAQKEKEEAIERLEMFKEEMAQKLSQERKEKDVAMESARKTEEEKTKVTENKKDLTSKLEQTELSLEEAFQKVSDLEKKLEKGVEEKDQALEKVTICKKEMAEMARNLSKELKEKEVAMASAKKMKEEMAAKEKVFSSKLAQKELSLNEAATKISKLENKVEHNKCLSTVGAFVWKSSGSKVLSYSGNFLCDDVLNCPPLKSGIFEWTIRILDHSLLVLGVIASSLDLPLGGLLGDSKKSWGYRDYGMAFYDDKTDAQELPIYFSESVVHFVLDLTGGGTLSVSVDESLLVPIFSNMKSFIDKNEGLLPVATMHGQNKIELLGCRYLDCP